MHCLEVIVYRNALVDIEYGLRIYVCTTDDPKSEQLIRHHRQDINSEARRLTCEQLTGKPAYAIPSEPPER